MSNKELNVPKRFSFRFTFVTSARRTVKRCEHIYGLYILRDYLVILVKDCVAFLPNVTRM